MIKFLLGTILAFFVAVALPAAEPELHAALSPESVAAGQTVNFVLTLNRPLQFDEFRVPELVNGEWINSLSRSTQIINGKASYSYTIPIRALKEGTLQIPSFPVKVDDRTLQTPELTAKVIPAGELPAPAVGGGETVSMKEAAFGRIRIIGDRKRFYVGEEIPVLIELFVLPELQPRLGGYPELSGIGNAVFRDYSAVNPEQRKFDRPTQETRELNHRRYIELTFRTAFRAVAPGKLTPQGTLALQIVAPGEEPARRKRSMSPFDDDFFDSFFSGGMQRRVPYNVVLEGAPELTIAPLPPAPRETFNLGLIGDWKIQCRFDQPSAKVGEPLSLNLDVEGEGAIETVVAPKLELPGFRIYPAEVKKQQLGLRSRAEIKYAMIPLEPGEKQALLKFASFNPTDGQYAVAEFDLKLPVLKSDRPLPAAAVAAPIVAEDGESDSPEEPKPVREELFYQKAAPGAGVALPLIRNQLRFILLCVIGGPLVLLVLELRHRRRLKIANDPEYLRRAELRRRVPELIRTLKHSAPEKHAALIRDEALPLLAEALNLSPGATAAEVSAKLADPQLKSLFESIENAGFCPGGAPESKPIAPELLEQLCRTLKKFALILLLIAAAPATQAADSFNAAFNRGDFKAAVEDYEKLRNPAAPSPAVLYNLGAAYYRLNQLPMALYCFEQAHLLMPRDSETLENLNLVRRKLAQPEIGRTDSPTALLLWCRDQFRPDQYLALAAFAFAMLCIGFGLRHRCGRTTAQTICAIAAPVLALALWAAVAQTLGPYDGRNAIVIGNSAELRTLPAAGTGRIEATIPGGSSGDIVDRRDQWVRLQINGRDGWMPADRVKTIFPGGVF